MNANNQVSFRWTREAILTQRDTIEDDKAILDAARYENDAGDHVFSFSLASVLNNRMTNEAKVGHVRESLLQGGRLLFDDNWKFIGFHGWNHSMSVAEHPPRLHRRPRNTYAQDLIRDITFDDSYVDSRGGRRAQLQSRRRVEP